MLEQMVMGGGVFSSSLGQISGVRVGPKAIYPIMSQGVLIRNGGLGRNAQSKWSARRRREC
jgi:hypothetical protein